MVVRTDSPAIDMARRITLELLVINHHGECLSCAKNNHCELQRVAAHVGVDQQRLNRYRRPQPSGEIDDSNPFFTLDHDRCVLCGICVRTCDEITGCGALDFAFRGSRTRISTFGQKPLVESRCESCGECVVRCPVGALAIEEFPAAQPRGEDRLPLLRHRVRDLPGRAGQPHGCGPGRSRPARPTRGASA